MTKILLIVLFVLWTLTAPPVAFIVLATSGSAHPLVGPFVVWLTGVLFIGGLVAIVRGTRILIRDRRASSGAAVR